MVTQIVCNKLYGHKFALEPADKMAGNPRTASVYKQYKDVLPSTRAVKEYKHKKALTQEILAVELMMKKESDSKIILHYDSTQLSRIEGEWPSLILNYKSSNPSMCKFIPLRPLFFAHEDRNQIIQLMVETLKRLASTV